MLSYGETYSSGSGLFKSPASNSLGANCNVVSPSANLIINHLHDQQTTLKACCLVSKSWILWTRKHLFARVEFDTEESHIELWKETFPDPPSSPAYYTRTLSISGPLVITAADGDEGGWILTFYCLAKPLPLSTGSLQKSSLLSRTTGDVRTWNKA